METLLEDYIYWKKEYERKKKTLEAMGKTIYSMISKRLNLAYLMDISGTDLYFSPFLKVKSNYYIIEVNDETYQVRSNGTIAPTIDLAPIESIKKMEEMIDFMEEHYLKELDYRLTPLCQKTIQQMKLLALKLD